MSIGFEQRQQRQKGLEALAIAKTIPRKVVFLPPNAGNMSETYRANREKYEQKLAQIKERNYVRKDQAELLYVRIGKDAENGMTKTQMVEKYQMKSWNIKARIKTYNPDFNFEKWDKQ